MTYDVSMPKTKVFMFLDDDAFHPEKIRHPRYFFPLIGAQDISDLAYQCNIVKFATVEGAIDYISREGCPDFISFDNDLMRTLEGIDLAKWLIERDLDSQGFIPQGFNFFVHSQNNVAKDRIYGLLGQYLAHRG